MWTPKMPFKGSDVTKSVLTIKDKMIDRHRNKIRNKAISRAENRIRLEGRTPEAAEFDPDLMEDLVKEEEEKIISELKTKGVVVLAGMLGLSAF